MTRETKVGLLVGMGMILLIGIIVSDHLAVVQQPEPADLTGYAAQSQDSIYHGGPAAASPRPGGWQAEAPRTMRGTPVPTPEELDRRTQPQSPGDLVPVRSGQELPFAISARQQEPEPVSATLQPQPEHSVSLFSLSHEDQVQAAPTPAFERLPRSTQTPPQPPAPQREVSSEIYHYVKRGETLYEIAHRYYGNGDYWRAIAAYNEGKVRPNGQVNENVRLKIPNMAGLVLDGEFVPAGAEQAVRVDHLASQPRQNVQDRSIEVQSGDTLTKLAARHLGSTGRWRDLFDANRDQLDRPEDLRAGMTLRMPGTAAAAPVRQPPPLSRSSSTRHYTVQGGDTLSKIAERVLGDSGRWQDIFDANRHQLKSPNALVVGQKLRLPG